ncbi:hypothetical protein BP5796_06694 [Coleophoma crateriformis]|uniref:Carboxypeptidase Y n=1 Tax=Coleophoma crateriformis TaxID=565419 RepID=A0A3D8RP93_9HELO|nr:hypothetical protein BP5796_06694 [Coleophoma crateriformis]
MAKKCLLSLLTLLSNLTLVMSSPIKQSPLGNIDSDYNVLAESTKKAYTIVEQDEDICRAGTKQYTGMIDVSESNSLFYWFFESRNDPENDPVVVWINGGPGGSSLFGLFREIGPCLVNNFGNDTTYNAASWNNYSSMLFIDQPAGVGFSSVNGSIEGGPATLLEAAADFEKFLTIFFTEAFPQFSTQPFHLTGESFAGHYLPAFTKYIGERQKMLAKDHLPVPIQSLVLVDSAVDLVMSVIGGLYDHFCSRDEAGNLNKPNGFNQTACTAMEESLPACEKLIHQCDDTYDKNVCMYAVTYCEEVVGKWLFNDIVKGGRDPYDDRKVCEEPPLCDDFANGTTMKYLNSKRVHDALEIPLNFTYYGLNMELNERFCASGDCAIPTTRELQYVLEEMDTKVLVINGNNDALTTTEGNIRFYEHLPWNKEALFRVQHFVDWFWPNGKVGGMKGGQAKSAGKLSFATVDEAGHTSPGDQPEAVAFLIECWVNGASVSGSPCPV